MEEQQMYEYLNGEQTSQNEMKYYQGRTITALNEVFSYQYPVLIYTYFICKNQMFPYR